MGLENCFQGKEIYVQMEKARNRKQEKEGVISPSTLFFFQCCYKSYSHYYLCLQSWSILWFHLCAGYL